MKKRHEVIKEPRNLLLSSFYLAPVEYYAALFHAECAKIEIHDKYQKQSYRNRCVIGGANGAMTLSIPIEKTDREHASMKDIRVSEHGNWRHLHWNAIISAYNSTPFFPYYEDDFRPFFEKRRHFLHDFNEELRVLVCRLLGIETDIAYTSEYVKNAAADCIDLREAIHPKRESHFEAPPYYQVFSEKHGFQPNLSIIDLLFNLGNEARLYLLTSTHPSMKKTPYGFMK